MRPASSNWKPKTFRLQRQIYARLAHWSVPLKTWVFEDGWTCEYKGAFCNVYTPFQATTFPRVDRAAGTTFSRRPCRTSR